MVRRRNRLPGLCRNLAVIGLMQAMTILPDTRPIRAIGLVPFATQSLRDALAALPGLEVAWVGNTGELTAGIADHDVALLVDGLYDAAVARGLAAPGRRTRWLALGTAGYGNLLLHGVPSDIVMTHASPVWAPIVAEHAVALLHALLRQVPLLERQRAVQLWDRASLTATMGALEDETVALVGYGQIGQEIARRLQPCVAKLMCFSRTARDDEAVGRVHALTELPLLLPDCHSVVLALALDAGTHHLFGGDLLARLPRGARLVNVARGGLVDTAALLAALDSFQLAGAALDVMEEEPLPAAHPLWRSERVILSPHVAGFGSRAAADRLTGIFVDNFTRALAGQPLRHEITVAR
jgi:phosphoglycerate dehydrogenase-like enzyme